MSGISVGSGALTGLKETVTKEISELKEIIEAAEEKYNEGLLAADDLAAIKLFEEALDIAPDLGEAWMGMGERYMALNLLHKAMTCFLKAGSLTGGVEPMIRIAEIWAKMDKYKLSSTSYKIVLRRDPTNLRALLGLAGSYKGEEKYVNSHRIYNSAYELIELLENGEDLKEWKKNLQINEYDYDYDYPEDEDEDSLDA